MRTAVRPLYEGQTLQLYIDDAMHTAWIVRTSRPLDENASKDLDALARAVASIDAASMGVIIDVRNARGRNDEEFEQRVLPLFQKVVAVFARRATLVATQIGKLQARRVLPPKGAVEVFDDEERAKRFAAGQSKA